MHLDGVKILGFEYTQSFLKNHQNMTEIFGLKMKKRFVFFSNFRYPGYPGWSLGGSNDICNGKWILWKI